MLTCEYLKYIMDIPVLIAFDLDGEIHENTKG